MRFRLIALGAAIGIGLAGCGGVANEAPITSPEGFYNGTTNDGRNLFGMILDDNTYYLIYTIPNNPTVFGGFIQGTGSGNHGLFTSNNALDFSFENLGIVPANLWANYSQKASFSGTVSYTAPTPPPSKSFGSTYSTDYEKTPSMTTLAGTYTGQVGYTSGPALATSFIISSAGAIAGTINSTCSFTGAASLRPQGNVYTVSVIFGPSPCSFPNQIMTGGAVFDDTTKLLRSMNLNSVRSQGVMIIGTKQP